MRPPSPAPAAVIASLAVLALAGCRRAPASASAAACRAGDAPACVRACDEGVDGEGGCATAALLAVEGRLPEVDRVDFIERACALGRAAACRELAIRTERRAEPAQIAALYDRACALGEAEACRDLAREALGRRPARASGAFARWCALTEGEAPERPRCVAAFEAQVAAASEARRGCDAGDPAACEALGRVLLRAGSEDAAVEAFAEVCALRGVAPEGSWSQPTFDCSPLPELRRDHPGSAGACGLLLAIDERMRIGGERAREELGAWQPPPPIRARRGRAQIGRVEVVRGQYPVESVTAGLEALLPQIVRCFDQRAPDEAEEASVQLQFLLDAEGRVVRPAISAPYQRIPKILYGCIPDQLRQGAFRAPASVGPVAARVELSFGPL